MKKSILCMLVATLAMIAGATPVTSSQAEQAALAWAQRNAAFVGNGVAMTGSAVAVTNADGVTLWYRVALNNGSCIVVSPVMELEPVIACLENVPDEGLPSVHPMRAMLERDMADRLRKLGLYVPAPTGPTLMGAPSGASPLSATPEDPVMAAWAEEGKAKWARLAGGTGGVQLMAAKEEGIVDIDTQIAVVKGFDKGEALTHWNQGNGGGGHCYNYHTPSNAVCGCVATMMSAIMQYFAVTGCPTGVEGVRPATYNGSSVNTNGTPFVTLGGTYDWGCLTNSDGSVKTTRADYNSLTETQRELLGRVAYDAGVAIGMAWTDGESGAITLDVAQAFRTVFGFKDARAVEAPTEEQYDKLIYHQCMAGAPVGLSIGTDGQSGGHAVVAVGYGEDEYGVPRTRIFTGWGGAGDGWYALPYINTKSLPSQSGSYLFDVIKGVITMIGYDSNETVPVVGHVDAPGEPLEVPGAATNTTIFASDLGYFGTRVAPDATDRRLICRGKEAQFEIGADAALTEDEYIVDGDKLCAALPEYIEFLLLNSSVAYTFAKAKEMALAEGKAILRVSGVTGTEPTTNLLAYVYALDDQNTGDFTNKFVYFFSSARSQALGDGNPSMGVFLPQVAEQDRRWSSKNGRLSYGYGYSAELQQTVTNDYEVAGDNAFYTITNGAYVASWGSKDTGTYASTNLPYTINGLLEVAQLVLDCGWDEYCRCTHGISLTVTATDEVGTPEPMFGIHENVYTNGQEITAIAPDGEVTNSAQKVVSGFGAWMLTVTNTVAGGEATTLIETGTEATFTLVSNDVATLTWLVVPMQVWIEINDVDDAGVTEPGSGWYAVGEQVTFFATPTDPELGFSQWTSGTGSDVAVRDVILNWDRDEVRSSPILSFVVPGTPLSLNANYDGGGYSAESAATTNYPVRVVSVTNGVELTDASLPEVRVLVAAGKGPVAMGDEIELPDVPLGMSVQGTVFTNSQGEVWQCVGWTLEPDGAESAQTSESGTSAIAAFTPEGAAVLTWVWELAGTTRRPLVYPGDVPVAEDGVSSPLTIYANADGTLTVEAKIGNAVAGWWYVLKTCDTLTGTYVPASPEGSDDVCWALAETDGKLELHTTFTPTDAKRFYKVTVEEEEP